jgi:hypothetical protein
MWEERMKKNYGKIITKLLKEHPEGLSISEIAKLSCSHRHTITKYVYKLIGAEVIHQRAVGAAKLCYLKEEYQKKAKKRKGQLQVLTAFLVLLLIPTAVIVAQNVTDSLNRSRVSLPVDLCVDVTCEDLTITCPDGWVAFCSNTCDPTTGECSACTPDCTGHEIPTCNLTCGECKELDLVECLCVPIIPCCGDNVCDLTEIEGESSECIIDCGIDCDEDGYKESWVCDVVPIENVTQPPNETLNESMETTTTIPLTSTTSTTTTTPKPPERHIPQPSKELSIETLYPEKITRGEAIDIKAKVVNLGSISVNNVLLTWHLPEGFEIISGNQIENCEILEPNTFCTSTITVRVSLSTKLGINDVKVVVSYE